MGESIKKLSAGMFRCLVFLVVSTSAFADAESDPISLDTELA